LPAETGEPASFVVQDQAFILLPYAGHLYQFKP